MAHRVFYVASHGQPPRFFAEDEAAARAAFAADPSDELIAFENGAIVESSEGATFLTLKRCFAEEAKRRLELGAS